MPFSKASEITFLRLGGTVFCVQCELISYNNSPQCLACGSQALLSLAHILGGTLNGEKRASVVSSDALDRVVRRVLGEVTPRFSADTIPLPAAIALRQSEAVTTCSDPGSNLRVIEDPLHVVLDRACAVTPATGAVVALRSREKMVCVATRGVGVPALGSEVGASGSLSALCVKTATTLRCDSSENDSRVDRQNCRELGVQSVVAAPVAYMSQVVGLLAIFSWKEYAFANRDVATAQLLANLVLIALMSSSQSLSTGGSSPAIQ